MIRAVAKPIARFVAPLPSMMWYAALTTSLPICFRVASSNTCSPPARN